MTIRQIASKITAQYQFSTSTSPFLPRQGPKQRNVFFFRRVARGSGRDTILPSVSSFPVPLLRNGSNNLFTAAAQGQCRAADGMACAIALVVLCSGSGLRAKKKGTRRAVLSDLRGHAHSQYLSRVHPPVPEMDHARFANHVAAHMAFGSSLSCARSLWFRLTFFVAVKNDRGPRWVQDKAVFWCKGCNTDFSFLVRKHHCRHCGHVFCAHCCSNRRAIVKYGYGEPVRSHSFTALPLQVSPGC